MNKLEYYNRQKEPFDEKELQDIKNEYESKQMTISQIGDIHHRTPGSISYKLNKLGLITNNISARGYLEYKNSDLYREIVESGRVTDKEKKVKNEEKVNKKIESSILNTKYREINNLRDEIISLKKDVKEILRLMNALYDFESQ